MDREEILRGIIGDGMPTPEEEFERVTGEDFDPERYEVEWSGAENYGEDDTYTSYRIVRRVSKDNDLESSNNYSEDEIRRAYDNAVSNAIALINLPEPTDSYEREAYNDEYLRRSEEIRRDLEILSDEQIREAEAEIARRTQISNDLTSDFVEEVIDQTESDELASQTETYENESDVTTQNQLENYSDDDIENRLREIWEEANSFSDELTEDDPLYVEYWALMTELNARKNKEKSPEKNNETKGSDSKYTVDSDGVTITFTTAEIKKGLDDYINPEKKEEHVKVENKEQDNNSSKNSFPTIAPRKLKNEKRGILRIRSSRLRLWPLIVSAVMTVAAGFGFSRLKGKDIERTISKTSAGYSAIQQVNEEVIENPKDEIEKIVDELKTGDIVEIPKGTQYFESSYNTDKKDKNELKQDDDYKVEYISIFYNGVNKDVVYSEGINIQQEIESVANSLDVSPEKLDVNVHISGPVSGWINYNDYVKYVTGNEKPDLQKIGVHVVDGKQVQGHEDDFDGIISFVDEKGNNATINFKKADGSFYKVGDLVTASNGETYRVDELDVKTTTTTEVQKGIDGRRELNWRLSNFSLLKTLIAAGFSIIGIPLTYRKKENEYDVSEQEFYNIAGLEGYSPDKPSSVWDYTRSDFEWPGLTFEKEKLAFEPDDDDQIKFTR